MARRELVFKDEITIWRDGDEFVAEWDNGYQPDRRFKRSYYNKSDREQINNAELLERQKGE